MNSISVGNSIVETTPNLEVFFEMTSVPIYCNLLWREQQAAKNCLKGDIKLAFSPETGLITNMAFDKSKLGYSQDYENSLHYSPRFQQYAQFLAESLVKRYDLYDKNIIEIACGKGDFLISLCQLGHNRGVGFDPSYFPRAEHRSMSSQVEFIEDFYSERYKEYQADIICCRHALEHVPNPADLLVPVRRSLGSRLNTVVFFEVPNGLHTFRHLAVWDIIYEHCCYFTPVSLAQAFSSCGFRVVSLTEAFDGQFLCIEALPTAEKITSTTDEQKEQIEDLSRDLTTFTAKFNSLLQTRSQKLEQMSQTGKKIVVWGAGSKGVTFLNLLGERAAVDYVVDLNPRKQGMYVAGTGQKIVPPEFLPEYRPDLIIVMNPIYKSEIQKLAASLGLKPEFICV